MTPEELRSLIRKEEGLKLDFKQEYKLQSEPPEGVNPQEWKQFVKGQWDEFIKDILALTNGNFGTVKDFGFLIIGVGDQLHPDGTRQLYDTSYLRITRQQIMGKVNEVCSPKLIDLHCEYIMLDGYQICVIRIPPSPYIHETNRPLEIFEGKRDESGKLRHVVKPPKIYSPHTAFIRRGEGIHPATSDERRKLDEEKKLLLFTDKNLEIPTIPRRKEAKSSKKGSSPSVMPPVSKAEQEEHRVKTQLENRVLHSIKSLFPFAALIIVILLSIQIVGIAVVVSLNPNDFSLFPIIFLPSLLAFLLYRLCFSVLYSRVSRTDFYGLTPVHRRGKVKESLKNKNWGNRVLNWYMGMAIAIFIVPNQNDVKKRK